MKGFLATSHSSNNYEIFALSLANHAEYCTHQGYDLHISVEQYEPMLDIPLLTERLKHYDFVGWFGTDIFITDMRKPLEDFLDPQHCCVIALDATQGSVNGDFILFSTSSAVQKQQFAKLMPLLDYIQRNMDHQEVGIQQAINCIFWNNRPEKEFIKVMPARTLQSVSPWKNWENYNDFCWRPGDFCIHFNWVCHGASIPMKMEGMKQFLAEHANDIIRPETMAPSPKVDHLHRPPQTENHPVYTWNL